MSVEQERQLGTIIKCDGVGKTFATGNGRLEVVRDLTLSAKENEFLVLFGPGQCGKTTIINLVAGLEIASAGSIEVDGKHVDRPSPERGVVFQTTAIFAWLTTMGNVEYGPRMAGIRKAERRARAQHYIDLVGLQGFENSFPVQLSGGMKQRVGIARVYCNEPKVMLMDEPFGALDAQTRYLMQEELQRIWQTEKRTIVFVQMRNDVTDLIKWWYEGRTIPPINILINPASGSCDLRCGYYFYRDEMERREVPLRGVMSAEVLEAVVKKSLEFADGYCTFGFQGGEPTLAGLDYFRNLVECARRHNHKKLNLNYAIQTNGVAIDDEWAAFLGGNDFLVGLSLDGHKELHDLQRPDASGRGTYGRVLKTARLLEQNGVRLNILTVVTARTLHEPARRRGGRLRVPLRLLHAGRVSPRQSDH